MTEVETDLDALQESYTPKQAENFETHMQPVLDNIEAVKEFAEDAGNPDAVDVETAKEWYIRTYRPKKRGSGLMKRDHVQIGEPEHLFTKVLGKLGNPWGSIEGMVMASFGISDETQEAVTDAAVTIYIAKHLDSRVDKAKLAQSLQEHQKVGELYGY